LWYELDDRRQIDEEIVIPDRGSAGSGLRIRVATQLGSEQGIPRTELNQPFVACHVVLVQLDEPPLVVPPTPPVQPVRKFDGREVFNALFLIDLGGRRVIPSIRAVIRCAR
jgi:hypothetical protein